MQAANPTTPGAILGTGPAASWLKRIRASVNLFNQVRPRRERFARALGLDWATNESRAPFDDPENFERHAVNWSHVYRQFLKSQTTGTAPVIRYSRDAGAGQTATGQPGDVPGDDKLGGIIEILMSRIVHDSNATDEWNLALDDISAWGPGCVAIGFSRDVIHPDIADNTLKSVSVIVQEAQTGDVEAKPGERHEEASEHLRSLVDMAADAEDPFEMEPEEAERFLARAQSHDAQAIKEARQPLPPAWDGHRVWARRLQPGIDVFWDSTVTRLDDTTWRARRIEMTLSEFRGSPLFKRGVKSRVKGTTLRGTTGLSDQADTRSRTLREDVDEDESARVVVLYEVWVKKPEMLEGGERHYVTPELPGELLESNSRNPYLDDQGRPLIQGFWPIFISVPLMAPINDPVRTFGIPAVAPGWPQQVEANALRALSLESARKHSKRAYVADPRLGSRSKVEKILSGPDAAVFFAPPGVKDAAERKSLLVGVDFSGNNEELDRQFVRVEQDWRQVMGVPAAVLAGQGASETLGQDELAAQAGRSLQGLIIADVQRVFADMVEGMRGLAKRLPKEVVVRMLGARGAEVVESWKPTALDGDRLWIRFGPLAAAQERVDRKQLMETIGLLEQKQVIPGVGKYDTDQYYEDLTRSQGLGAPKLQDPQHLQVLTMAAQFQMLQEKVGPDGIRALMSSGSLPESGGGGGSPVKSSSNDPRGPSNANIGVGARRGAKTVNN